MLSRNWSPRQASRKPETMLAPSMAAELAENSAKPASTMDERHVQAMQNHLRNTLHGLGIV